MGYIGAEGRSLTTQGLTMLSTSSRRCFFEEPPGGSWRCGGLRTLAVGLTVAAYLVAEESARVGS